MSRLLGKNTRGLLSARLPHLRLCLYCLVYSAAKSANCCLDMGDERLDRSEKKHGNCCLSVSLAFVYAHISSFARQKKVRIAAWPWGTSVSTAWIEKKRRDCCLSVSLVYAYAHISSFTRQKNVRIAVWLWEASVSTARGKTKELLSQRLPRLRLCSCCLVYSVAKNMNCCLDIGNECLGCSGKKRGDGWLSVSLAFAYAHIASFIQRKKARTAVWT